MDFKKNQQATQMKNSGSHTCVRPKAHKQRPCTGDDHVADHTTDRWMLLQTHNIPFTKSMKI